MGVLEMPEGYDSRRQILLNTVARLFENYPWLYAVLAVIVVLLLAPVWLAVRLFRRRRARGA
jgi:hypothetical protein